MTKSEFLKHVRALYVVGNRSDSDSPDKEDWTHHTMAETVCARLDQMMASMVDCGALTLNERQAFYDTL